MKADFQRLARALWYAIGQECVNRGNKQEREYAVGSLRSLMLSWTKKRPNLVFLEVPHFSSQHSAA